MKRLLRQPGFSLPEVLVAVAMFGIMGAAISSVILLNVRTNRISRETTAASSVAQSKIEGFRASNATPSTVGSPDTVTLPGENTVYTRSWTVSTTGLPAGVYLITVNVTWREPQPEAVQLTSYVTR
jgi:prepilin-type N-terminal cleavage/methylation domain-containing protein